MALVEVDESRGSVAVVTMQSTKKYNALGASFVTELREAFRVVSESRNCLAVVLTGAGKGFCAGADLTLSDRNWPDAEGRGRVGYAYKAQEHLAGLMLEVHECPKPVIAAIHGAAIGGGLGLALACDIRIAAVGSIFSARFIKIGTSSCDVGTSYFLPRFIGAGRAAELMLTGRDFEAEEAERIGLLTEVTSREALLPRALLLADHLASLPEFGTWSTKSGLWTNLDAPSLRHAMELEGRTQTLAIMTGNVTEFAQAFQEKREPNWKPM